MTVEKKEKIENKTKLIDDLILESSNLSQQSLYDRILSSSPGCLFVDTAEENRLIKDIYRKFHSCDVNYWSSTQGLIRINSELSPEDFSTHKYSSTNARTTMDGKISSIAHGIIGTLSIIEEDCRIKEHNNNNKKQIYILRDVDPYFNDAKTLRKIKDIVNLISAVNNTIIICGPGVIVPNAIEKDVVLIKYEYPTRDFIRNVLLNRYKEKMDIFNENQEHECEKINADFDIDAVADACVGLTEEQMVTAISHSLSIKKKICIDFLLEEKRSIINKNDILEYWICNDNLDSVGGFGNLKKWLNVRKVVMKSNNASKFGAKSPKGIMLIGVQGSGKTFIAKSIANSFNMGLIKLEMGKVFAGVVGESEKRMRQALRQIEAAGGVVVIDEIDKGLSGAGSSDRTDGGTTSRVIGSLLTWLQEDHPGVFLVATANDISRINANHPELLRKGRFDEIWFSDLPNHEERKDIFTIHLKKHNRDISRFDLNELANIQYKDPNDQKTYGLTGAEIEYAITDALSDKFALHGGKTIAINSNKDINTADIIEKLKDIKPISFISKDTITAMRKWSSINARNVSDIITEKETASNKTSVNILRNKISL